MARKVVGPTGSRRRRWLLLLCLAVTAGTAAIFIPSALGTVTPPQTAGFFELDKNAHDDATTWHVGTLNGQIANTTTTSVSVCELATDSQHPLQGPPTPLPATILIDGEQMTVSSISVTSSSTNSCKYTDPALSAHDVATYTVTRGANSTTKTKHPGSSDVTWLISETKPGVDWKNVYDDVKNNGSADNPCSDITDAVACTWQTDPPGKSIFTGGTSDTEDITDWTYTDSSVPDADEILDAYAIKFSNSDQFLFFGADRYAVNGAKDMGFWFFKNPVSPGPNGKFVDDNGDPAVHADGDILILGTFTQGGAVTTIRVFRWNGTTNALDIEGTFGDCVPGGSGAGCNTVNSTTIISPWDYAGKGAVASNVIYGGGFMEGGVDLGALDLTGCFSNFMAETRSSPSLTAESKDFTLGNFENCGSGVTTTPADSGGTALTDTNSNDVPDATIGTGGAGVDVTDNADLTVTGLSTWSGTVDFHICGPLPDTTSTCDTGGVDAGSKDVDQDHTSVTSPSVNLTSVGYYCWRGDFTPSQDSSDAGLDPASDASSGECFEVLPVTPTLSTAAVADAGGLSPTIIGGLADLNGDGQITSADSWTAFYGDTSIISGGLDCDAWSGDNDGTQGSGHIDGSDDCTLVAADGGSGVSIDVADGKFLVPDGPLPTVFNATDPTDTSVAGADFAWSTQFGRVDSNGNGSIDDDDCTFDAVGGASILGAAVGCGNGTPVSSSQDGLVDLNADGKITAADDSCIHGCFLGHDVSGGHVLAGTIPFGGAVYDVATLTGTANAPGDNGGDNTYPSINATNGAAAGGTIRFTLVADDCKTQATGTGSNPEDVGVTGDGDYQTGGFTPDQPGAYHWQASYDGDSPNTNGTDHNAGCDDTGEDVTVQQIPTEIKTAQSWYPNDTATITSTGSGDKLDAGGTVDFFLYDNATCDGTLKYEQRLTLAGGNHSEEVSTSNYADSTGVKTDGTTTVDPFLITTDYGDAADSETGSYSWKVVYTPDGDDGAHTGKQSACTTAGTETFDTTYTNDPGPGTDLP